MIIGVKVIDYNYNYNLKQNIWKSISSKYLILILQCVQPGSEMLDSRTVVYNGCVHLAKGNKKYNDHCLWKTVVIIMKNNIIIK